MVIRHTYLQNGIAHAIVRARTLLEISQNSSALELRDLQRVCTDQLNDTVLRLAQAQEALEQNPNAVDTIGRVYQVMSKKIDDVQRLGVFALKNQTPEDIQLNRLLNTICEEINYPLIPPTVSHTSQRYFEISPPFNLLRVPLIEGRFFLQLADLYHELCHPLLSASGITNPKLDPLSAVFLNIKNERGMALDRARVLGERRRAGPDMAFRYALWRRCWIETWTEEFLCDAFGAFCAGPAYGWTHFHLCFRGNPPLYDVPKSNLATHPDDAARMIVILEVLRLRGFEAEANAIQDAWTDYVGSTAFEKTPAFELCYPTMTLQNLASISSGAFGECGLIGLSVDNPPQVSGLLQDAWHMFWTPNTPYETWEESARQTLSDALS